MLRIIHAKNDAVTSMAFKVKHQAVYLMWFSLRLKQFFCLGFKRKHKTH